MFVLHSGPPSDMYPTTLTQLARGNPFSAPLFTLQKTDEPETSSPVPKRRLAAAAVAGKTLGEQKYYIINAQNSV